MYHSAVHTVMHTPKVVRASSAIALTFCCARHMVINIPHIRTFDVTLMRNLHIGICTPHSSQRESRKRSWPVATNRPDALRKEITRGRGVVCGQLPLLGLVS